MDRESRVAQTQTRAVMSLPRLPAGRGVHEGVIANQPPLGVTILTWRTVERLPDYAPRSHNACDSRL